MKAGTGYNSTVPQRIYNAVPVASKFNRDRTGYVYSFIHSFMLFSVLLIFFLDSNWCSQIINCYSCMTTRCSN